MPAKFLIIEDNRPNLDLMVYLLKAFSYEPVEAVDGETALKLVEQQTFDLIICDIQLPGIDGYELVTRFKANERLKNTPVVAVSALAMVGDRERIMSSGFDGYMAKPIQPDTFVATLEEFLPNDKKSQKRPVLAVATETQTDPRPPQSKATILLVDDHPSNLDVMRSVLEPSGYKVYSASSGDEALQVLELHRPDLILSDMHLVGEADFEFIERIKVDARWKSIPFVFISSTTKKQSVRMEGFEHGAVRFIFRPIEPQALLAEIEACLNEVST